MVNLLGKRNRRVPAKTDPDDGQQAMEEDHYRALLRQHFEAKYESLDVPVKTSDGRPATVDGGDGEDEDDSSSSWVGISNDEIDSGANRPQVEVVDHTASIGLHEGEDAALGMRRSFMTSRIPSSQDAIVALKNSKPVSASEDVTSEASQMANDMALQRLLRESKLLSESGSSGVESPLQLSGKSRHIALDTHLQSLGAKSSVRTQKNMPRVQRIGMTKKATQKEATRRREAREAGVVLEKAKKEPREKQFRERGVGAPGVGKFRGGTLTLSAKDIRNIQGRTKSMGKKGRR